MGTPRFAVPSLERILDAGHRILAVFTQPDRPKGRGGQLAMSPVKQAAIQMGLPVHQPERIRRQELVEQLRALRPAAMVVVGYGQIIPQSIIDIPPHGIINVHGSLLPKYRGAAPIQWAIANGESVTGVTTMRIDAGLDTGDMLMQREQAIGRDDTSETLGPKLATIGADLMIETLRGLESGRIPTIPQDNSLATLAPILKKEDGRIDFARTADDLFNRLRGFQPWPGAFTLFRGKTLQVRRARPHKISMKLAQAQLSTQGTRLFVGCGPDTTVDNNAVLELIEVQVEGKRAMSAQEFINGYRPQSGDKLGQ